MIFPELIKELATRVESAGGVAELVGGGAISWLTGETPSDWDIEVSGVGFERLEQISLIRNQSLSVASLES